MRIPQCPILGICFPTQFAVVIPMYSPTLRRRKDSLMPRLKIKCLMRLYGVSLLADWPAIQARAQGINAHINAREWDLLNLDYPQE
jgi:hypothetical protein